MSPLESIRRIEGPSIIDWSRAEEAERFEEMLRWYREGKVGEDEFRRFRLQHGTYSSRFQQDFSMVRVKIPSGELRPEQLEKLAELSEVFSIGSAHVSTRENMQLHWVYLGDVPEVLRELSTVGLTTREACGNTIRNVTASPLAGVCPFEPFDATPYAKAVAKFFLRNPLNQNLPRKFKINFSCCDRHSLARIADIGAIPLLKDGERGFRLFLGGGLGPASFVAEELEEFTPEKRLLSTCMAVVRLFDRLGDRQKMHRNRMRYLVHDMGFQRFRELVLQERRIVEATLASDAKLEVIEPPPIAPENGKAVPLPRDEAYQRWFFTNALPQRQRGFFACTVTLPCGDISAEQMRGLAQICRRYSKEGVIRLTPEQNIVIRWIAEEELYSFYQELKRLGLGNPGGNTIASAVGCSGTTSCNLAITNSHRLAKELQRKILELGLEQDEGLRAASIKLSGCPNSCGQHMIATLGFYGGAHRFDGGLAPTYQMLLGGKAKGSEARLGTPFMRVPARRVMDVVLKVIELYRSSRREGEGLDEWVDRILRGEGPQGLKDARALRSALEPLATIPSREVDPQAYIDWGNEEQFRAKTSRGECAV